MEVSTFIIIAAAFGLAFAGVIASGYECLTGRRLRFPVRQGLALQWMSLALALRLLAGPALILRQLSRPDASFRMGDRIVLATLACVWSMSIGVIILTGSSLSFIS